MASYQTYQTAPLACLRKANEIRKKLYQDELDARAAGKLLIQVSSTHPALFAPFDCVLADSANYTAFVARQRDFAVRAGQACDAIGYSREMCGYFRNDAGSMLMNEYAHGGRYPKPNAVFEWVCCSTQAKWYQVSADHHGVPYFAYEAPLGPYGQNIPQRIEYLAAQLMDGIAWLEKVTGQEFDDEKFVHGLDNMYSCEKSWAEICLLQASVPVPVSFPALLSLMSIPYAKSHESWCRQFVEEVRAEIKYRVENHIAASAVERCRLATDAIPPWHAMQVFKYAEEQYGAVFTNAWIYHLTGSMYDELPDGSLTVGKTPAERGIFPRNREEAVRLLAQTELERQVIKAWCSGAEKDRSLVAFAGQMKVNAMALHANRGCPALSLGVMQSKMALQEAGIPVVAYEGNHADPTDTDADSIRATFDALMALLGIKPLT